MAKRLSVRPIAVTNQKIEQKKESELLEEIQRKITSSAALNGGFDTLLFKIDKIEQCQGQIVTKVDKIHDSIYDPIDGIFAKIGAAKIENAQQHGETSQKLAELTEWKKHQEKSDTKHEQNVDDNADKIVQLEKTVDHLTRSKDQAGSIIKWIVVALGGGAITLIFNWIEKHM